MLWRYLFKIPLDPLTQREPYLMRQLLLHLSSFTPVAILPFSSAAPMNLDKILFVTLAAILCNFYSFEISDWSCKLVESVTVSQVLHSVESIYRHNSKMTHSSRCSQVTSEILGGNYQWNMETSLNFSLTSSQLSCNAIHQLPTLLSPRIFRGSSKHWRKKQLTTYPGHSQSRPSGSIRVGKHEMDGQDSFPARAAI